MQPIKLSQLLDEIDETLNYRFSGETFWITAELSDVKKQPEKRWCFLKFIEKDGRTINAEMRAVFWSTSYYNIEKFEQLTRQPFANGLVLNCEVRLRFHARYGLDLEVLQIDLSYAIGQAELERQHTLDRLVAENPATIRLVDGQYLTRNKRIGLRLVLQRIALVTAPNSDGRRDFVHEISHNNRGYAFAITEFLTQIQGEGSSSLMIRQLKEIESRKDEFDVVAIVRGGGSDSDFKPFEDYELARFVAAFPLPVFTGIGHDRNTSIVDMMARQFKTPTKVASSIIEHNFNFEREIIQMKERIARKTATVIQRAKENLKHIKRTVKAYSPATILGKGYAMVMIGDKILVNPDQLQQGTSFKTILKNEVIHSDVLKKEKYESDF